MMRWHPNKIHFPISSLDTSKLLHIPNALTFGLHFHPSIHFHTAHGCHKNKHNAIRHLFETNNIASTVNKQHQIAFYFVPIHFIFWRFDFDNTPFNRLSAGVEAAASGGERRRRARHTSQFAVFKRIYFLWCVFACRFNSIWPSLVAVVVHVLVAFSVYAISFSFRFVLFLPFSLCLVVDGYWAGYRVPFATPWLGNAGTRSTTTDKPIYETKHTTKCVATHKKQIWIHMVLFHSLRGNIMVRNKRRGKKNKKTNERTTKKKKRIHTDIRRMRWWNE